MPAIQRTLGLIKPDATTRGLTGKILSLLESQNFKITALKMMRFERKEAESFYAEHAGKPFFTDLIDSITSGPVVAFILEHRAAVSAYRNLMGHTNPDTAQENTIRGLFGLSLEKNTVHGSDSSPSAVREIDLIFNDSNKK